MSEAALAGAMSIADVVAQARAFRGEVLRTVESGNLPHAVAAAITGFNDAATRRLIVLTGAEPAFREARACWIALGSEGRFEQTLASDQDNALLFADDGDPQTLLPHAAAVNDALDACGLARCRGEIMAGNPAWCLPEGAWRARFAEWMDRPDPQALLNAAVFFDFRPIAGDARGAERLRRWLTDTAPHRGPFLISLARNALGNGPPLGLFGRFARARSGPQRGTIDLKTNGVQPFVEVARLYALAHGVDATGTVSRLQEVGRRLGRPDRETAALCDAFGRLQWARLAWNRVQIARGEAPGNFVDPEQLSEGERRALRDAFEQSKALLQRMTRDFALNAPAFGA
jgi:CBS domain-containing protein